MRLKCCKSSSHGTPLCCIQQYGIRSHFSVFSDWKLAVACFYLVSQAHKIVSIFKMKTHATGATVRKVLLIMRFQFLLRKKPQYIQPFIHKVAMTGQGTVSYIFLFASVKMLVARMDQLGVKRYLPQSTLL